MVLLSQFLALSAQIIMCLGNGAVEQRRLLFYVKDLLGTVAAFVLQLFMHALDV